MALADSGGVTDGQIEAIRSGIFGETRHGVPGVSEDAVDVAFASRLYAQPGALGALDRILGADAYAAINQKLGQVRETLSLEIWAEIVADYKIRIELNNAGKSNGGRSDLDVVLYTDAERLAGMEHLSREQIHRHLIDDFKRRWAARTSLDPGKFDHMVFSGDGMLMDWRMSKSAVGDFTMTLNRDIARLSQTEGAYFIPGGYKKQVYNRYLNEGRTTVISAVIDNGGVEEMDGIKVPPGVVVRRNLRTAESSLLYGDVPSELDRNAGLGDILQNRINADAAKSILKNTKYSERGVAAVADAVNLDSALLHATLEGRDVDVDHFVKGVFAEFEQAESLPANLKDLADIRSVIDRINRIQADKIIGNTATGQRPKNWSDPWRNYQPRDIGLPEVKLEYFAEEAAQFKAAMRAAHGPGFEMDDSTLAGHAEGMFRDKARAIARMSAARAARSMFNDLFTREGFSRQAHLHGAEAAARQIAESVKGLHAAFVFLEDEALIRSVVAEAPALVKAAVEDIRKIARAQRADILQHKSSVEAIEEGQMAQSDAVLRQLLRDLGQSEGDFFAGGRPRNPDAGDPDAPGDGYARRSIKRTITDALASGYRITPDHRRLYAVAEGLEGFVTRMGKTTGSGYFQEYGENFLDIGTVDAAGKVAAALVTGNPEQAYYEARNAILENAPYVGKVFSAGRGLKAWREQGEAVPLLMLIGNQAAGLVKGGADYAKGIGWLTAVYGLEQSLYQIGWHFIGQPVQNDVVSFVLMGRPGRMPGAAGESAFAARMPNVSDEELAIAEKAALLGRVRIPPALAESGELRDQVLRAHFRTAANHRTQIAGEVGIATPALWAAERDRILDAQYLRFGDYWLRRLHFYESVNGEVLAHLRAIRPGFDFPVAGQPPGGIDPDDPAFADARVAGPGGEVLWDHEKVHLRRFFERWVSEWKAAFEKDHGQGAVLNALRDDWANRAFYTGDWQSLVVGELVGYYREGEMLAMAREFPPEELEKEPGGANAVAREKARGARDYTRKVQSDTDAIARKILEEEGADRLARIKIYATLGWKTFPEFQQKLVAAGKSMPEYQPEEPKLEVEIPRPVGRPGDHLRIEAQVTGDAKEWPGDLEFEVRYRQDSEQEGKRPPEVLADDILTLFGRAVEDEKLTFIKHTATVHASSPSVAGFSVPDVSLPVYWITYADPKDEDEAAEDADGDDAFPDVSDLLEQLRQAAEEAEGHAANANRHCADADAYAAAIRDQNTNLTGVLDGVEAARAGLLADVEKASTDLAAAGAIRDEGDRLLENLATARNGIGDLSLEICGMTEAIKESFKGGGTEAERRGLLTKARAAMGQLKADVAEARAGFDLLVARVDAAGEIAATVPDFTDRLSAFQAQCEAAADSVQAQGDLLQGFRKSVELSRKEYAHVTRLQKIGKTLLGKGEAALAGIVATSGAAQDLAGQMRALYGRIVSAEKGSRDCPDRVAAELKEAENRLAANRDAATALREKREELKAALEGADFSREIDALNRHLEGTRAFAEILWESILHYQTGAALCLVLAEDLLSGALVVKVPAVLGKAAADARQALAAVGLQATFAGGKKPDAPERAFTVEAQNPEPGAEASQGASVALRIYDRYEVTVPAVVGLPLDEARGILAAAGLSPVAGPSEARAPRADLEGTVATQAPEPLAMVEPGTRVEILGYGTSMVTVPFVLRFELPRARAALAEVGLAASVTETDGEGAPPGSVLSQAPDGGTEVQPGTAVRLIVSRGAEPAAMPDAPAADDAAFYIAFDQFMVNFQREKPDKMKFKDFLAGIQPGDIRIQGSKDGKSAPVVMEVGGAALAPYPKSRFARGGQFSADQIWTLTTKPGGEREPRDPAPAAPLDPRAQRALELTGMGHVLDSIGRSFAETAEKGGGQFGEGVSKQSFEEFLRLPNVRMIESNPERARFEIGGAILLQVAAVYDSREALLAAHPDCPAKSIWLNASADNGAIAATLPKKGADNAPQGMMDLFSFRLEPLVDGWPESAKRKQIEFFRALATLFNCFVITAVYDFDVTAPQLHSFRRFRDRVLRETPAGNRLISWYYRNGPHLAEWVVGHPASRLALRPAMDGLARCLDSGTLEHSRWQRAAVHLAAALADDVLRSGSALIELPTAIRAALAPPVNDQFRASDIPDPSKP